MGASLSRIIVPYVLLKAEDTVRFLTDFSIWLEFRVAQGFIIIILYQVLLTPISLAPAVHELTKMFFSTLTSLLTPTLYLPTLA